MHSAIADERTGARAQQRQRGVEECEHARVEKAVLQDAIGQHRVAAFSPVVEQLRCGREAPGNLGTPSASA